MFFAFITTLIVLGFYLTFSRYLGKIESDLTGNRQQLEKEIVDHMKTEDKLAAHQAKLDDLVEERTRELEKAVAEIKVLSGFLPICASCKNIRTEKGEWEQIESYIRDHTDAEFSHSYCPKCAQKMYSSFRK